MLQSLAKYMPKLENKMEILLAILGGSALAALVNQVGNAVQWNRQRKASLDDQGKTRLDKLEAGLMAMMLDRIQYLCKRYLKDQSIDVDDRRRLHIMHECYHTLGGNGDLDKLMEDVNKLPID